VISISVYIIPNAGEGNLFLCAFTVSMPPGGPPKHVCTMAWTRKGPVQEDHSLRCLAAFFHGSLDLLERRLARIQDARGLSEKAERKDASPRWRPGIRWGGSPAAWGGELITL